MYREACQLEIFEFTSVQHDGAVVMETVEANCVLAIAGELEYYYTIEG